jgi:lipoprotein-anchoring transpeptidase ErfK/SrfK
LTRGGSDVSTDAGPTTSVESTVPTTAPPVTETIPPQEQAPPNTNGLPTAPYVALQAKVAGALSIYDAPDATSKTRTLPNPVPVDPGQPKITVPLILLQKRDAGNGWLEVYLPIRPNGSTAFVRDADVSKTPHSYRIEVNLSAFSLKAYNGSEVILDAKIATAAEATPTPGGLYYTNELLKPPDPNTSYGTYAYGLSGYSDTLKTFNQGPGQLGIHGTNEPKLIGQRVSHGCIRMTNQNIEKLAKTLPLGVPVFITA